MYSIDQTSQYFWEFDNDFETKEKKSYTHNTQNGEPAPPSEYWFFQKVAHFVFTN